MSDGGGESGEPVEIGDLRFNGRAIGVREGLFEIGVIPFLREFIEGFLILIELFFQRFGGFVFLKDFSVSS